MGSHLLFLVDFIIAQNLEKVKFWDWRTKGAGRGRGGNEVGREGSREVKQGRGGKRKIRKENKVM